jgi:hypothetical protein
VGGRQPTPSGHVRRKGRQVTGSHERFGVSAAAASSGPRLFYWAYAHRTLIGLFDTPSGAVLDSEATTGRAATYAAAIVPLFAPRFTAWVTVSYRVGHGERPKIYRVGHAYQPPNRPSHHTSSTGARGP